MTLVPPGRPDPASDAELRRLSVLVAPLIASTRTSEAPPSAVAVAVRYVLAIQATDVRGDACRFPRCACAVMDCSRRPSGTPPSR